MAAVARGQSCVQCEEDKGKVRLDEPLQRVLNVSDSEARLTSFAEHINPLLLPLDPLRIEYTIRQAFFSRRRF